MIGTNDCTGTNSFHENFRDLANGRVLTTMCVFCVPVAWLDRLMVEYEHKTTFYGPDFIQCLAFFRWNTKRRKKFNLNGQILK